MSNEYVEKIIENITKTRFKGKDFSVASETPEIEVLSTGIGELDQVVLGIGGLPCGQITEAWGPKTCGKSTLAGFIVSNMQKQKLGHYGGTAALFGTEGKFYPEWWKQWDVDLDRVIIPSFTCGEDAYDKMMALFGKVDIVILDSIAMLLSKEEAVRIAGKQRMGSEARMHKTKLMQSINGMHEINKATGAIKGKISERLSDTKTVFFIINQIRANIGIMFGSKEKPASGHIVEHLASIILRMDVMSYAKQKDESGGIVEQKIRLRADKNIFAPPLRSCDVWLNVKDCLFRSDSVSYLLNKAINEKVVEKRGAWLYSKYFPGEKLQGMEKFLKFLNAPEGEKMKKEVFKGYDIPIVMEEELIENEEEPSVFGSSVMEGTSE